MNLPRQIVEHGPYVILGEPFAVVDTKYPDVAAEIVRRWNAHDPMRSALRRLVRAYDASLGRSDPRPVGPGTAYAEARDVLEAADKGAPPIPPGRARPLVTVPRALLVLLHRVAEEAGNEHGDSATYCTDDEDARCCQRRADAAYRAARLLRTILRGV